MEKLSNNLYSLRTSRKLTQKQLADAIGTTTKTIYSIESEKSQPTLLLALRIANFFELQVDDIFTYTPDASSE